MLGRLFRFPSPLRRAVLRHREAEYLERLTEAEALRGLAALVEEQARWEARRTALVQRWDKPRRAWSECWYRCLELLLARLNPHLAAESDEAVFGWIERLERSSEPEEEKAYYQLCPFLVRFLTLVGPEQRENLPDALVTLLHRVLERRVRLALPQEEALCVAALLALASTKHHAWPLLAQQLLGDPASAAVREAAREYLRASS